MTYLWCRDRGIEGREEEEMLWQDGDMVRIYREGTGHGNLEKERIQAWKGLAH